MTENQISSQYMYIEIVTGLTLLQICKVSQLFRTGRWRYGKFFKAKKD